MSVSFDLSITLGNLIEIGSIIGGGAAVLLTLRADVKFLREGAQTLRLELAGMQAEIKELKDVLVDLAEVRGEIKTLDARVTGVEQDIREFRHGDGFIRPRG